MKIQLTTPLSSEEIIFATGARYRGKARTFTHIATSSYDADENTLFFALQGRHTTGEDYVKSLELRGICSVSSQFGDHLFTHPSVRDALLLLAKHYKSKLSNLKRTVAVTGSVGKTTTKEFLSRILMQRYRTYANVGNFNSDIGLPLTMLEAPLDTEMLVLEFGMNHRGEIEKLAKCALPDIAVITNIGHAHIGNLGSLDEIAMEKMDVCAHDDTIPVLIPCAEERLHPLKNKIILGEDIRFSLGTPVGSEIPTVIRHLDREYHLKLPILSEDFGECLRFALGIGILLGVDEQALERGARECASYDGRRRLMRIGECKIIDDTYNASPQSMLSGMRYLMAVKGKRHHAVIGDMLELGEHTAALHTQLGVDAAGICPDFVYLFGEYGKYTREGLLSCGYDEERIFWFEDTRHHEGLLRAIVNNMKKGDVFWLKASHGVRLWRIIESLKEVYA